MSKEVKCVIKRGIYKESEHLVHSIVIDESYKNIFESGNINNEYCLRSTLKPFQCAASIAKETHKKYNLNDKEIAVTCASHHGEQRHIKAVLSILNKINLTESDLDCGFHFPLDKDSKSKLHSNRLKKSNIFNNCSGKHAGILALIKNLKLTTKNYIDHAHPIHDYINNYIEQIAKVKSSHFAIDGCSLPTPYYKLFTLADLYMSLISSKKGTELNKVFKVMTAFPEMVSGKLGFDTFFMNTFKNIGVSKGGAEGMQALALYTRKYGLISLALKVADGNHRGNYMACIKILRHIDAIDANEELQLLNFIKEKQVNLNGIATGDLQCYISN